MTTTPERHPDIEIYLKNQPVDSIQAWLSQRFEHCKVVKSGKNTLTLQVGMDREEVTVMVIEGAAGQYTSLWFDSDRTPWPTDRDCAREAFAHFATEVRCIAGGWQEGDAPDEWWSISQSGEQTITWQA